MTKTSEESAYADTMQLPCYCPDDCSCRSPYRMTVCGCTRHCWELVPHAVTCPVCGARRALAAGEGFPTHPNLSAAQVGRLQWCSYAFGVTAGPIASKEV